MMRGERVSCGFRRSRGGRSGNSPLPVRGLVDGACCVSKDYRQLACGKVAALVEEYKLVASQFKGKKKEEPAPAPEPEPNGNASVS